MTSNCSNIRLSAATT